MASLGSAAAHIAQHLSSARRLIRLIGLMLACCMATSTANAFTVSGTVRGPSGAVAGAEVEGHSGGVVATTTADGTGHYALDLPEGALRIFAKGPTGSDLIGLPVEQVWLDADRTVHLFVAPEVEVRFSVDLPPEMEPYRNDAFITLRPLDGLHSFAAGGPESLVGGVYTARVPAGRYALQWFPCLPITLPPNITPVCTKAPYFSHIQIDAQADIDGLVLPRAPTQDRIFPRRPPRADLIQVAAADADGIATVTGLPGAVDGVAMVWVMNLQTSQYHATSSAEDGSFAVDIFAPEGSVLSVHQNPSGVGVIAHVAGTIVRTDGAEEDGFMTLARLGPPFTPEERVRSVGMFDAAQFWISGALPGRQLTSGQILSLSGTYRIYSRNKPDFAIDPASIHVGVELHPVIGPDGKQQSNGPQTASRSLTPSGFPIERPNAPGVALGQVTLGPSTSRSTFSWEGTWTAHLQIPSGTPTGVYQFAILPTLQTDIPATTRHYEGVYATIIDTLHVTSTAALVEVGQPTERQLGWALMINDFSNGARGVVAEEDRQALQIAARVNLPPRHFIVPMRDERTDAPISYTLEPFAPLTASSNRGWLPPPTIPFEFPSGELTVRIEEPDGEVRELGSAPFAQAYVQGVAGRNGDGLSAQKPEQYFGLTTLDDRFTVQFEKYGLHRVTATGWILDQHGATYTGGGTYHVHVARTLDLETGVFPNTAFEVGDAFAPTVIVQPGVPAEVEVALTHYPGSDPSRAIRRVFRGQANRFGYFHPDELAFEFAEAGEYRVDYTASYTDERGVLWMGSQSWGSVVETPASPLLARGKRNPLAWLSIRETSIPSTHLPYPYFGGDIAWMEDASVDPTFTAHIPQITIQDTVGDLVDHLWQRAGYNDIDFDPLIAAGEIPLKSTRVDGLPAPLLPEDPGTDWGYYYAGSARPGVRVREVVSENESPNAYWRFEDEYAYQLGVGRNGDLPNDFKFQFGGAVYRSPSSGLRWYGAYGSLWVLLPHDDPVGGRVMPPFQGAGGGPSGGPIMSLRGQDVDIFIHPMGVRPGSILEVGDTISFSGQVGPPLPSQVEVEITAPDGARTTISGRANKVGYFHLPGKSFAAVKEGRYAARVRVWHDGMTSAGPVEPPYPEGGILGSADGSFLFHVVDPQSPRLRVNHPRTSFVQPAIGPIPTTIETPSGLSEVAVTSTTVMPGFMMEQMEGGGVTHAYDAPALHLDFPNLDLHDVEGTSGVDTVTLSYVMEGRDAGDRKRYFATQLLLQGEELIALPDITVFRDGFDPR